VPSARQLLASLDGAAAAIRFRLVGKLGHIRRRRLKSGKWAHCIDFRPYGRVWSHRGIQLSDRQTAERLMEQIRAKVAEGRPLDQVLAQYQPAGAKGNLVPTWLERWIEVKRQEADAGSLSPLYILELERLSRPGEHFSFFERSAFMRSRTERSRISPSGSPSAGSRRRVDGRTSATSVRSSCG
jgi:hypothetical protein